jgi:tetratricopeptide (TPR) repeat protein
MDLDLPKKRRYILMGLAGVVLYSGLATREFLGWFLSTHSRGTSLLWAARLVPENAAYHNQLGRYHLLVEGNLEAALREQQTAVRLNQYDSDYWFDLARTRQVMGDVEGQATAVQRALAAEPTRPDAAWQAGNFFLLRGENSQALRAFRVVLENDPQMAPAALEMCWRVTHDVNELLRSALPQQSEVYLLFIEFLASRKEPAAAHEVWSALASLGQPFEPRRGLEYINYLLRNGDAEHAAQAWQQMASLTGLTAYLPNQNLIVNPSFELDVLNQGFDWRYAQQPYVTLQLDANEFVKGNRALAVHFDGHGVNDAGIYQLIPVRANTEYSFSARFKTENLEGAGGPRLVVQDGYSNAVYFSSEDLLHAGSWHQVNGSFATGDQAKLVVLRLLRVPANNAIRGTLWLDDFLLAEKTGGASR